MARWISDYHLVIFLLSKFDLRMFGGGLLSALENSCKKGWNSTKKILVIF